MTTVIYRISVIFVVQAVLFVTGCDRSLRQSGTAAPKSVAEASGASACAPGVPATAEQRQHVAPGIFRLPGMDALCSNEGLRVKVLTAKPELRCTAEPGGDRYVGAPLPFFTPFYVFELRQLGDTVYYCIGETPRRDSVTGWISSAHVVRWDHRVGVRYRGSADADAPRVLPLLVYPDHSGPTEILKSGSTKKEPIARAMPSTGRKYMPWPVIAVEHMEIDGKVVDILQIAFLGEFPQGGDLAEEAPVAPGRAMSDADFHQLHQQSKVLEITFVLDATGSMQPFIRAAQDVIKDLAERLKNLDFKPQLHLTLVIYRDYDKASGFVTRSYDCGDDLAAFNKTLDGVVAGEGGDEPEAVFDAVLAGLQAHWTSPYSQRILVLLANSSGHEPGHPENPHKISRDSLVEMAKQAGVIIFPLAVGSETAEDRRLLLTQSRDLAVRTGGECFELMQARQVVDRVRDIMTTQTARVQLTSTVIEELRNGKGLEQIASVTGGDIRAVTDVMVFLQHRGLDPKSIVAKKPTFSTGWILPESRGAELVQREVLIARSEVDITLSAMNLIAGCLDSTLGQQVWDMSMDDHTNPLAKLLRRPDVPVSVNLQAMGVPVGYTSVLRLKREDLQTMSEQARLELRERISKFHVPSLDNWRTNSSVWRRRGSEDWTWIPENLLP